MGFWDSFENREKSASDCGVLQSPYCDCPENPTTAAVSDKSAAETCPLSVVKRAPVSILKGSILPVNIRPTVGSCGAPSLLVPRSPHW